MNTISSIIIVINFQILVSVLNPLSPKKTPVEEPVEDQTQPTITLEVSTARLSVQCVTQTHDCYQVPGFTYPTGCLSPIMEIQTPLATPCPSPLPTPLLTRCGKNNDWEDDYDDDESEMQTPLPTTSLTMYVYKRMKMRVNRKMTMMMRMKVARNTGTS